MRPNPRRTAVILLLVTAALAAVLWALPRSQGDGAFSRFVQATNENEGFFGFLAFLLSAAALLVDLLARGRQEAPASNLEQNYLKQMEWVFQEMRRHPLGYTEEEVQSLQAELIEPVYRILKTVTMDEGGRAEKGKLTRDLVGTLLRSERPVVVLGDPGAGKSVSLRQAGLALVRRGLRRRSPRLPVYLRLGAFTRELGPFPQASARELVRESLRRLGGHALEIAERFDAYLQEGRLVLLLDAMDEMPRGDIQARFDALAELQHFTGNKLLFACRKLDFRESFPFQRAVIQPFGRRQVRRFLDRALGGLGKAAAREVLSRANPLRDMAGNPFFLKLLALFYQRRRALPASRAELLREYEAQVFGRARGRASFPPGLADESLRAVLARLAYLTTRSGRGVTFHLDDLRRAFLPGEGPERERLAPHAPWARSALEVAKNESLLLFEEETRDGRAGTIVSFYHHRLQEYYTAVYLEEVRPEVSWAEHLDDIWWQEILIMLFGITADPRDYVRLLLGSLPAEPIVCRQLGPALQGVLKREKGSFERLRNLDSSGFYGLRSMRSVSRPLEFWSTVLRELERLAALPVEPGSGDVAALGKLSPEPDRNDYCDWVRRWLEDHNSVVLDRAELAAECLRNAAGGAPREGIERLVRILAKLAEHGNPWERVRAIQIAARLPGVDLYAVLEPALLRGDGWSRREAMAAISRYPLETSAYLDRAGLIVFLLFAREELPGSLPRFFRSLAERPSLARFLPGTAVLLALSLAVLAAPLLLYRFLLWRFPAGFAGLDGALGLPWATWGLVLGGLVTAWIYVSKAQANVPVLRSTLTAVVLCLALPEVLPLWQGTGIETLLRDVPTTEKLRVFVRAAKPSLLTGLAFVLPLVAEWLLVSCLAAISFPLLWSTRILRVPRLYLSWPGKRTYVETGLIVGAFLGLLLPFVISGAVLLGLGAMGQALLEEARALWSRRETLFSAAHLREVARSFAASLASRLRVYWRRARIFPRLFLRRVSRRKLAAELAEVWAVLRESSAELWQDILRYPVSSSIVLACLAMTVAVFRGWLKLFTALLFSAVALFVLVLFLVLRELLQALVLYSRTAWGASDRSSRERFAWYRDAVRRVRADWVRSLLWQEMAKSYKEMRQESLRPRAARPAEGEVPEGLGDDA